MEVEKQTTLELERQRQAEEARVAAATQIREAAGALAQNNLRLGATSDVYAQALAASRGIQPGTPEYDRLVKQIQAEDTLRMLQGKTLGWEEQLNRDKLVQWFADMQQRKAALEAEISLRQQIAYWAAIANGSPPPVGNPFTQFYAPPAPTTAPATTTATPAPTAPTPAQNAFPGAPTGPIVPGGGATPVMPGIPFGPYIGQSAFPGLSSSAPATAAATDKLNSQVDLLTKAVSALQQIQKNTTLVQV